jgi:hypothetical protein
MKRARLQAVNPVLEPGLSNKDREAYYEALAAKCGPVYPSLTQLADMNQSGFTSTEEGLEFHRAFECGLKVAYLAEKESPDLDILAHLAHVDRQACEQYLMRYQAIVDALPEYVGVSLSLLPDAVKDQLSLLPGV